MTDRPSPDDAADRVLALTDTDEDLIHSLIAAGEDETYWYYIIILEREYEGNLYLNERYVQLAKPDTGRDDTYKKNGINRRAGEIADYAGALSVAYDQVRTREQAFQQGAIDTDDINILYLDTHDSNGVPDDETVVADQ
jgi:hypothetical protein